MFLFVLSFFHFFAHGDRTFATDDLLNSKIHHAKIEQNVDGSSGKKRKLVVEDSQMLEDSEELERRRLEEQNAQEHMGYRDMSGKPLPDDFWKAEYDQYWQPPPEDSRCIARVFMADLMGDDMRLKIDKAWNYPEKPDFVEDTRVYREGKLATLAEEVDVYHLFEKSRTVNSVIEWIRMPKQMQDAAGIYVLKEGFSVNPGDQTFERFENYVPHEAGIDDILRKAGKSQNCTADIAVLLDNHLLEDLAEKGQTGEKGIVQEDLFEAEHIMDFHPDDEYDQDYIPKRQLHRRLSDIKPPKKGKKKKKKQRGEVRRRGDGRVEEMVWDEKTEERDGVFGGRRVSDL